MNLKYCRSTSLHLSPVDRRSFQLSIILPFVRASTRALRAERFRQVRFLLSSRFLFLLFFTIVFFSFSLFLSPSLSLPSLPPSLPSLSLSRASDQLDRCTKPHIRVQRPCKFTRCYDKSERIESHNKITDSNSPLRMSNNDRRLAKLMTTLVQATKAWKIVLTKLDSCNSARNYISMLIVDSPTAKYAIKNNGTKFGSTLRSNQGIFS